MCAVEWKKLGDVCTFQRGGVITEKEAVFGDIPVLSGGQKPAYYHNKSNRQGETIVVAGSGAYAGFVSFWNIPVFLSDSFSVNPNDILKTKYVFYFLKNIQDKIFATKKGSGVPHVHGRSIAKFEIPIPSLAKQQEIVSQLDTFTTLISNLESELDMRRKQYEHYREELLDFEGVKKLPLSEIFEMRGGYTPSTNNNDYWEGGIYPWFRMEDIRENGYILNDSGLHITPAAVKKKGLFPVNTIILATSATIGVHALLTVPALSNQRFTAFYPKEKYEDKINCKFTYYVFFLVDEWCKNNTVQGGFASVDMVGLRRYLFPIPSIETQQQIVEKLDAFEQLIQSLETEIKLRKQQYEYYREKLLTFE